MLELIFIFLIGLFFGSFFLVVADRLGQGKSFITGRSMCEFCRHTLSWIELIPVLSFLLQGGRCKHCKKRLSVWYPIAEIATGLLLVLVYLLFIPQGIYPTLLAQVIASCLLIIFITDYKYEIIPFPIIIVGSFIALISIVISSPVLLLNHLLSGLAAGLFFLFIFFITKGRGMGFGDVVFAVFMGLVLGFPFILAGLYIAFISGALISLLLVLLKKKKLHGGTIPFGPFLVLGTAIMLLAGKDVMLVISSYLGGFV